MIPPIMPSSIPIEPTAGTNSAAAQDKEDVALRQACLQFEEVFTATLLKKGLTQAAEAWGDEEEGANTAYKEMAFEQMAQHLGGMHLLGLADTLYSQIKQSGSNLGGDDR